MKKLYVTIKILGFLIVGSIAASCNDSFMDRYPMAEVSPENSFKTARDLELYTNGFYENLPEIKSIIEKDLVTDNVLYTNIPVEQRSNDRVVPSDVGSGGWSWGTLRTINLFLIIINSVLIWWLVINMKELHVFSELGFILIK